MLENIVMSEHLRTVKQRALAHLSDIGGLALVATSPSNVQYLTGYRSWTHPLRITNQSFTILTKEGKVIILIPSSNADFPAMNTYHADELVTFGTFFFEHAQTDICLSQEEQKLLKLISEMKIGLSWADALINVLRSEGVDRGRIVIDQGHFMPSYWQLLTEKLPEANLIDGYSLMLWIRSIKTQFEIEMLKRASRCTEEAILSSLKVARTGAADVKIRNAYLESLINSNAEHLFSAIGVGTRTCFPNVQPNGTHMKEGRLLRYDVGCRFGGYASDIARIATMGPASDIVRRYHAAMLRGLEAALEIIRPGIKASEIYSIIIETVRKSGVPNYRRNHCGHAIGLDSYEFPLIRPEDQVRLEPGMTFSIETPYYEIGVGGIQLEDMVVVTESGAELLTSLSHDIFELTKE